MIRFLQKANYTTQTVKIFTLDKAQPFKDPKFIMFPVKGTYEIRKYGVALERKHLVVRSYSELKRILG